MRSYEKWTHTDWRGVHYKCASLALRRRAPRPNDREAPPATMGRCRGISCLTHSDACGFWAPAISQSCQMRTEDIGPPRLCQHPEPIPWLDVGARAGHQMSESAHVRLGWLRWNGDAQTAACREPATGLPAQPTDTRLSSADRRRCWVRRCREARRRRCQPRWVGVGRCGPAWFPCGGRGARVCGARVIRCSHASDACATPPNDASRPFLRRRHHRRARAAGKSAVTGSETFVQAWEAGARWRTRAHAGARGNTAAHAGARGPSAERRSHS